MDKKLKEDKKKMEEDKHDDRCYICPQE